MFFVCGRFDWGRSGPVHGGRLPRRGPRGILGRAAVLAVAFTVFAAGAWAQPVLTMIDWVPAGLTVTNAGQATLQYNVTGTSNVVDVFFVRDDGFIVTVAGLDPAADPGPYQETLPLPTGVDRQTVTYTGLVRDTVTGETAAGDRAMVIIADDIGPDPPNIETPASFPYTNYTDTLTITGNVNNNPPPGGNTDTPEEEGNVVIARNDTGEIIGGGVILPDSTFTATADLSGFDEGVATPVDIWAVDEAGNPGTTLTVQIVRQEPPPPTLDQLVMTPADGTVTNNPAVTISGVVNGEVPPFTVNVFVDGLVQSQITGLQQGQQFNHTLTLPSDGPHTISINAVNSNTPPDEGETVTLGTITLDTEAPEAPRITRPSPSEQPFVVQGTGFLLEGYSSERDSSTTDPGAPYVTIEGPSGIVYSPALPLEIDSVSGMFSTSVDVSGLDDGTYTLLVRVVDEAGNTDTGSTAQVVFVKDTRAPSVLRVLVNGVPAPQSNPEIYVGYSGATIDVMVDEPMQTPPSLEVTQYGGSALPAGISSSTDTDFTFFYGVVPDHDGPVDCRIHGGADRAGNEVDETIQRLFVVDTTPPRVLSIEPADGTSMTTTPERIRIHMEDPLSEAGTAAGLALRSTEVTVEGPVGGAMEVVTGTLVPYDPMTVDFIPSSPFPGEGTYRIRVTAVDKVGNRSSSTMFTIHIDSTPIDTSSGVVRVNPPDGAYVNAETIPGGASSPYVEAFVNDPQFDAAHSSIVVKDYCRVPPTVPGTGLSTGPDNLTYRFAGPLAEDGSDDGIYTVELEIRDFAGNVSPTYVTTFVYDTQAPEVLDTFPSDRSYVGGPLRMVDALLRDAKVDTCRANSGIDRTRSVLRLYLEEPNENVNEHQPQEITGTLRFVSVGDAEKVLLEITNHSSWPQGLPADGSWDGKYRLEVEAFDRAGNSSGVVQREFVYDTLRPVLSVEELEDGDTLSAAGFSFEGETQDDRGGSGIEKVAVWVYPLDSNGYPMLSQPLLDAATATLKPLGPGPFDPDPPRREYTFSSAITNLSTDTWCSLVVRSYDWAGNFAEKRIKVFVRAGTLPPPQPSMPAADHVTSDRIVTFGWSPVYGADGYRLRIVTPNANELLFDVTDGTYKTVNLGAYSDGDGAYHWQVASVDAGGVAGSYSQMRTLVVDSGRPTVLSVDVVDPSPEASGSVNEGEVRFTIRFSEPLDTSVPLAVKVRSENTGVPELEVSQVSFSGDTWTGRTFVPTYEQSGYDYNGLATLTIEGGRDPAGNELVPPQSAFCVFEIDSGPHFRAALFRNPVDERDVILVVKGFKKADGAMAETLADPLAVRIRRQGEADRFPTMRRLTESVFYGSFRFDPASNADLFIDVTGTDAEGNTETRTLKVEVERLGNGDVYLDPKSGLALSMSAAGAAPGGSGGGSSAGGEGCAATSLLLSSAPLLATDGEDDGNAVPRGLQLVRVVKEIGPRGVEFAGPLDVAVRLTPEDGAEAAGGEDSDGHGGDGTGGCPGGLGLYLLRSDDARSRVAVEYLGGGLDGGCVRGKLSRGGVLILARDVEPPVVVSGARSDGREVRVGLGDGQSGVDPSSLVVSWGGKPVEFEWDAGRGEIVVEAPKAARGGELRIEAADRAGNRAVFALQADTKAPPIEVAEAAAYPNPARAAAYVAYRFSTAADTARLRIYDAAGRLVRSIGLDPSAVTRARAVWDLRDRRGRPVANGVYFLRVEAGLGASRARRTLKVAVLR